MTTDVRSHLKPALKTWAASRKGPPSVATPYLTAKGLETFIRVLGEEAIHGSRWLVCLKLENVASGFTDLHSVLKLISLGAEVRSLKTLHAKLYLLPSDGSLILGSANLTGGGLTKNEEIVLWTDGVQITSRASELFMSWWAQGEPISQERCEDLQQEVEEARAREQELMQLAELAATGAFVTITASTPDVKQQHTIHWGDVGVPEPGRGDIRSAPPTLLLWPRRLRRAFDRVKDRCRRWVDSNAVEWGDQAFLPRELFAELDKEIEGANERISNLIDTMGEDEWRLHRTSLETQLRTWLQAVAKDQNRQVDWVERKFASVMRRVPQAAPFGFGLEVGHRLEIPHPDSGVDIAELAQTISKELARRARQEALPGLG